MPQHSAGILLYRRTPVPAVLLVHPGGPYWARRQEGAWQIPKGQVEPDEAVEDAARREVAEELGVAVVVPSRRSAWCDRRAERRCPPSPPSRMSTRRRSPA
ncbi:NUDIX domain-containing protein [Sphingomonas hankookensis]|uniref:NUDIX domain-containing protein n=1 Tax=Sphingomonas hankookensis TaxID=563996 RepID=UPI003D303B26